MSVGAAAAPGYVTPGGGRLRGERHRGTPTGPGRGCLLRAFAFHSDSLRVLFLGQNPAVSGRARGRRAALLPRKPESGRCARGAVTAPLPAVAGAAPGPALAAADLGSRQLQPPRPGGSALPHAGTVKVGLSGAGRARLRVSWLVLPPLPAFRQAEE